MIPEGTLMRVNHHTKDCMNFIQQKYYFVQQGDGIDIENWSLLYDEIEDFKFILGYIYDLDVNIIEWNLIP